MGFTHEEGNFLILFTCLVGGLSLMAIDRLFFSDSIAFYIGIGLFVASMTIGVLEGRKY